MCFWRHPTYLAWEVPFFSQNEPNFSQKIGFTWETNPARRNVPGTYVESPAHADDLVERFPGAEACQFMGAGQHFMHRIFYKTLPFLRRGLRISPEMGYDALRSEEEHHWIVPLPAASRASTGRGEQGKGEVC